MTRPALTVTFTKYEPMIVSVCDGPVVDWQAEWWKLQPDDKLRQAAIREWKYLTDFYEEQATWTRKRNGHTAT